MNCFYLNKRDGFSFDIQKARREGKITSNGSDKDRVEEIGCFRKTDLCQNNLRKKNTIYMKFNLKN